MTTYQGQFQRPLQANGAGDARALGEKKLKTEVMLAYQEALRFGGTITQETCTGTTGVRIPMLGKATAHYLAVGDSIIYEKIKAGEITLEPDDLLYSASIIHKIDEALASDTRRSEIAAEHGKALARHNDRNIARTIARSALITDTTMAKAYFGTNYIDGDVFSQNVTGVDITDPQAVLDSIFLGLENLDNAFVDIEDKSQLTLMLKPAVYWSLFRKADALGNLLDRDKGGNGSLAQGVLPTIAGIKVMSSHNIPTQDESASLIDDEEHYHNPAKYRGNYTGLYGLLYTKDAAATVSLIGINQDSEYDMDVKGHKLSHDLAVGHSARRPACAVALMSA